MCVCVCVSAGVCESVHMCSNIETDLNHMRRKVGQFSDMYPKTLVTDTCEECTFHITTRAHMRTSTHTCHQL